jgi:hypothetical protein
MRGGEEDKSILCTSACSFELSVAYFQPVSSVFLSHKSANSTFSRLFSTQANKRNRFGITSDKQ